MATEQIPEFPDLRTLRRAYEQAIAASLAAEGVIRAARGRGHGDPLAEQIDASTRAIRAERAAGRAFMAALRDADPACRVCGCTTEDACWDDEHGPCSWVEDDLCSACSAKENDLHGR